MKSVLLSVMALTLFSTSIFATESSCTSAYAVGLNHFFKGEIDLIAEEHSMEETIETAFHKLSFTKGNLQVLDLNSDSLVEMKNISQDTNTEFYISTKRLSSHPLTWSGMHWGSPFMMIICSDEL